MGAEQSTALPGPSSQPATPSGQQAANQPRALVVCGPSGVGKKTLINLLLERNPGKYEVCISHTTRSPRPTEIHGSTYYFTHKDDFEKGIHDGKFLEQAVINGHYYGTSRRAVENVIASGKIAILEIDVQGARQLRRAALGGIFVFIAPPTLEELQRRLKKRGRDTQEQMLKRLKMAKADINSVNDKGLFDYLILNDELETCYQELQRVAKRAAAGLAPEAGMMPDQVLLEEEASADITKLVRSDSKQIGGGSPPHLGSSSSTAPAAASSSTPRSQANPTASAAGHSVPMRSPRHSSGPPLCTTPPAPGVAATPLRAAAAAAGGGGNPAFNSDEVAGAASVEAAAAGPLVNPGMFKWKGRVALVTGASSGIGWAVCETLGRAGMRVVAVARRRDRLEQLQQHMLSSAVGVAPVDFLPVVCDITKEPEVAALPRIVAKRWPDAGIDVLVNNAGLARNNASLFDGATSSWLEMLSTNVLGNCMCTREVLQDMQRRGSWGHIINMVGLSGHRIPDAPAGGTFFAATKFAVRALTEGLRQEARSRGLPLRVSGISPGLVETEFFAVRAFGDTSQAQQVTSSMKCLQPSDVADAILWCLSAPEHMEVNDIIIRPAEQMI